jgi:Zn-dependent protease/CBS domain-containing protein
MRDTFSLGRIAGIRVGVHWSVLVIFGLIAYGLSAYQFPHSYPGQSTVAYVAAGLSAAVVFAASLLAHELGHAVIARRNGLTVEGITLWLFGGVARLSGEVPSPGAELRIAGIGPLISLLLGVLFGLADGLLVAVGVRGLPISAVGWLAAINIALAVFNIVPAAPLDGGRLLRAFVWARTGDRIKATMYATRGGQIFGWLLIVYGLLSLFTTGSMGGLWLALIGWFLTGAAAMEEQLAKVLVSLAGVPVEMIMTPDPVTVPGSTIVADFVNDQLFAHRHSTFPITDEEGNLVGLVTLNQIKQTPAADRAHTTLRQIACPIEDVTTTRPDEPVTDILPKLTGDRAEGRALVFADGRLVGFVSPSDVTRALQWAQVKGPS